MKEIINKDKYTEILKFYIKTTEIASYTQWVKENDNEALDNHVLFGFINGEVGYLFEFLLYDMIKYKLMIAEIFKYKIVSGGVETFSQLDLGGLFT